MMVTKDEWLRSAISDDRMVTDLLLRLKHSSSSSSSISSSSSASVVKTSFPPLRWGIRLPRSRMAFRFDTATSSPEKKPDSARNSPTTPLAWSAGGSAASSSGTTNGSDESTLPVCRSSDSRSKVVGAVDPGTADANKSKRKKTFAELKEEEVSLLKERVHLNKEITSLHTTFKEHTSANENLKRMKLDFDLNATNGSTMASDEKEGTASSPEKETILISRTPPTLKNACLTVRSSFCQVSMPMPMPMPMPIPIPAEEPDRGFLLPDLNMTPSEDDFTLEGLHGVGSAEAIGVATS